MTTEIEGFTGNLLVSEFVDVSSAEGMARGPCLQIVARPGNYAHLDTSQVTELRNLLTDWLNGKTK